MKFLKKFVLLCVLALGLAACGGGGGGGGSVTPPPPTFTGPATFSVAAETGAVKMDLSWSAVSGASYYNIYRSATANVTVAPANLIATVTSSPYIDNTNLAGGTTYYYVVTAVNGSGTESTPSAVQHDTTITVPATPTGVGVTPGSNTLTVNWTASAGNITPDGYNVYYSTSSSMSNPNVKQVTSGTTASLTTGISNGTKYYVTVTAYKSTNGTSKESVATAAVSATPGSGAPTNPSNVVANTMYFGVDSNNNQIYQIYLTWDESDTVDSYNIYYSVDQSVTSMVGGTPSATVPSGSTKHTTLTVPNMPGNIFAVVTAVKGGVESGCAVVTALPFSFSGVIASGSAANFVDGADNVNLTMSFTSGTAVTITGNIGSTTVNDTGTWTATDQLLTINGSAVNITYDYTMQEISSGTPIKILAYLYYKSTQGPFNGTMTIQ